MEDFSYLDKKYFIDPYVYNCPFCNRRNVYYSITHTYEFNWKRDRKCYVTLVRCSSCKYVSMHMSFQDIVSYDSLNKLRFRKEVDIDSAIFYSVPTSFLVLDSRIPVIIRELITEAEGSLTMNFLTGASACIRKAIYELLVIEKAEGADYESKIKFLKGNYPDSDPMLFDILAHIKDMTSDKIHEQSWDKWDSKHLKLIIETLKTVLHDIYVLPKVKAERSLVVQWLRQEVEEYKKGRKVKTMVKQY